jgi:hypothetical protein
MTREGTSPWMKSLMIWESQRYLIFHSEIGLLCRLEFLSEILSESKDLTLAVVAEAHD